MTEIGSDRFDKTFGIVAYQSCQRIKARLTQTALRAQAKARRRVHFLKYAGEFCGASLLICCRIDYVHPGLLYCFISIFSQSNRPAVRRLGKPL